MGTNNRSNNREREMRQANHYMAHVHTKAQPPHFRPIMIIAVVLSLGMFITGLILTIVAYRPGHSAMGGDPLKIAGPVLLSIGGVIFILCMIDICRRLSKDRRHVERSYAAMQAAGQLPAESSMGQQSFYPQSHNTSMQYAPSRGSYRQPSQSSLRMPSQSSMHADTQAPPPKTVTVKAGM